MGVKVSFIGRLGANADVVNTQSNTFISFRTAVNDRVNKENVTTWMTVTADYNRYKNMVQYLTQGTVVSVYGTERCSTYETKTKTIGIDRKVVADSIEFVNLGKKQDDDASQITHAHPEASEITTGGLRKAQPATVAASTTAPADDLPF